MVFFSQEKNGTGEFAYAAFEDIFAKFDSVSLRYNS